MEIQNVSDTALWVAHYRAEESKRPDALFHDDLAGKLAGEKGARIARSMGRTSKYVLWNVITRTVVIDRYLENAVAGGVDTVLNLGAGLDTRPYRMKLPESLRWIEVDQASIIDHKEKALAGETPRCRLERVRMDLSVREARQEFLSRVCQESRNVLVMTEGVLPYLTEAQVAELAEDLQACDRVRFWVAEYMDKRVYRFLGSARHKKRMGNAPFQFMPQDWLGFFEARGWKRQELHFLGEEGARLNRPMPMPLLAHVFKLFMKPEKFAMFRRMTGYILFARMDG